MRVFIPFNPGHLQVVSRTTISSWLVRTIRLCYENVPADIPKLTRVNAHEVRASAASWALQANLSVTDIMRACSWRPTTTFASYYLRDCTMQREDMFSLGNFVAAQHVLNVPSLDA